MGTGDEIRMKMMTKHRGIEGPTKGPPEKYMPRTPEQTLGYLIEECGEVLAAAGKSLRWGLGSSNPELPEGERETNREWLLREMDDLEVGIQFMREAIGCNTCGGSRRVPDNNDFLPCPDCVKPTAYFGPELGTQEIEGDGNMPLEVLGVDPNLLSGDCRYSNATVDNVPCDAVIPLQVEVIEKLGRRRHGGFPKYYHVEITGFGGGLGEDAKLAKLYVENVERSLTKFLSRESPSTEVIEQLREGLECVHRHLDNMEAPRHEEGSAVCYSIVGRIKALLTKNQQHHGDLLTRMHGDGGHHINDVGWEKASQEAEQIYLDLRAEVERLQDEAKTADVVVTTHKTAIGRMSRALQPLIDIADAYDDNALDDEARKRWGENYEHENKTELSKIELYAGRGGKQLLTLQHCFEARYLSRGLLEGVQETSDQRLNLLKMMEWEGYDTEAGERACPCCGAWRYNGVHGYACGLAVEIGVECAGDKEP